MSEMPDFLQKKFNIPESENPYIEHRFVIDEEDDEYFGGEYWRRVDTSEGFDVDPRVEKYAKLVNAVGKTHSHICGNEEHLTALYRYGFENLEVGKLCDIQTEYDYVKLQRNMAVACWFLSFVGMMIVAHFV